MKRFEITPNTFRVADFIGWQREGSLRLNPAFQRRSVWRPGARSYFIDTLARGLPVPLIFVRERVDLDQQKVVREVVDGQQRLRTVIAFVDPGSLADFDQDSDGFAIRREHNPRLAGRPFSSFPEETKRDILGYRFSVQILPSDAEDREVLQIFARLNSTGIRLNAQELRNAAWFGKFKTRMYELSYGQLERWLGWSLFNEDQVSRMLEVELVSDVVVNMIQGLAGKSQPNIDRHYEKYDTDFPHSVEIGRRFEHTMDAIDALYGTSIATSVFRRQMHFFSLWAYVYDRMYGLGSPLQKEIPNALPHGLNSRIDEASRRFGAGELPVEVLEAVSGAATDLGRRKTRLDFTASILDGKTS